MRDTGWVQGRHLPKGVPDAPGQDISLGATRLILYAFLMPRASFFSAP
jgi:hypothetical protein